MTTNGLGAGSARVTCQAAVVLRHVPAGLLNLASSIETLCLISVSLVITRQSYSSTSRLSRRSPCR